MKPEELLTAVLLLVWEGALELSFLFVANVVGICVLVLRQAIESWIDDFIANCTLRFTRTRPTPSSWR